MKSSEFRANKEMAFFVKNAKGIWNAFQDFLQAGETEDGDLSLLCPPGKHRPFSAFNTILRDQLSQIRQFADGFVASCEFM